MKDSQQGFGSMEDGELRSYKGSREGLYLFVLICHSLENNCFKQNICLKLISTETHYLLPTLDKNSENKT